MYFSFQRSMLGKSQEKVLPHEKTQLKFNLEMLQSKYLMYKYELQKASTVAFSTMLFLDHFSIRLPNLAVS